MRVELCGRCRHDRGHATARPPVIVSSAEPPVQRDVTIEGSGAAVRLVADGAHRVLDVTGGHVEQS
jgi:hypothetical protein